MNTLHRYLLRNNLLYVGLSLGAALGIYLLIDVFDRLDEFIEAGLGLRTMTMYFLTKTPFIISQVLPAVFLLSLLIQIGLMRRSRELTALETSGIAFYRLGVFFLVYGMFWCGTQLFFSEVVGVTGEAKSRSIWKEQVRKKDIQDREIHNAWFKEGRYVVHMGQIRPSRGQGRDLRVYVMGPGFDRIERVLSAASFTARSNGWTLHEVREFEPERFLTRALPQVEVPLTQDPTSFLAVDPKSNPETLPLWRLRSFINRLEASGSNVERLLTAYHMKWAYAFSILVMVLLALALTSLLGNIYLKVTAGLGLTFVYYGLFIMGGTMGENGMLPPWLGAWFGNFLLGGVALARLAWISRSRSGSANVAAGA